MLSFPCLTCMKNFARNKKRKSRSRGASARRTPSHKNRISQSVDKSASHRSTSVDISVSQPGSSGERFFDINRVSVEAEASVSMHDSEKNLVFNSCRPSSKSKKKTSKSRTDLPSCSSKTISIPNNLFNNQQSTSSYTSLLQLETADASSILALADEVATAAIARASSALKDSQESCDNKSLNTRQTDQSTFDLNSASSERSKNISVMVSKTEDNLDKLSTLLDRLDSQYGSNSNCPNKSAHLSDKKNGNITLSARSKCELAKNIDFKLSKESPRKSAVKTTVDSSVKACSSQVSPRKVSCKTGKDTPSKISASGTAEAANKISDNDTKSTQAAASPVKVNGTMSSQEEKQALRKAKKASKKQEKEAKSVQHIQEKPSEAYVENVASTNLLINHNNEKTKAELKRERREKQESQRAAKASEKEKQKKETVEVKPKEAPVKRKVVLKKKESSSSLMPEKWLPLFSHLIPAKAEVDLSLIHPAIRAAGLSMKDRTIDGCNARVVATLSAISAMIEDYSTPPSCDLSRDLADLLTPNIAYLHFSRPIPEPMNNAIRFVKHEINSLDSAIPEIQAKEELRKSINTYIDQNLILASKTISQNALEIIENEDIILTFGYSSLVLDTIKAAVKVRHGLSVVVVDKPVPASGASMFPELADLNVKLYYRVIPDTSSIMNKVTKVMIEAEAVVLNGAIMAVCGTAGLALAASTFSIPVIALSHTYKFCNIDLTDSLVVNELGDPDDIVSNPFSRHKDNLSNWQTCPALNVVNLVYDVTPADMISVLVTERNILPTTVVPTIIKRNFADVLGHD